MIVPGKNEERRIGACLQALRDIDFPPDAYEVIVVDNGSSDATVAIAESYGVRVFSIPDVTISALRNYGASQAKGEFLAFVDADVVVSKDWLKNALTALNDPGIACVGSYGVPLEASAWVERAWTLGIAARAERSKRVWLASMNMVVRAKAFHEIGGFNERLVTCEDVDFGYRLSQRYGILEDKSVRAMHLGEPKTLSQLFRKEMWRGRSNFTGVLEHGLLLAEIPSLLLPLFYLGLMITVPVTAFLGEWSFAAQGTLASGIFPFLRALALSFKARRLSMFPALFVVWWVYGFARACSIFLELRSWRKCRPTPNQQRKRPG